MVESIRKPAVAGRFYPGDANELVDEINKHLDGAKTNSVDHLKALVVPHAGYAYSGPIAGSAYSILRDYHSKFQRVVIIGPAHRLKFNGVALSGAEKFQTPLGNVSVAQDLARRLTRIHGVHFLDQAHQQEHSLEVHVPFLQTVLDDFSILPVVVGKSDMETVEQIIDETWDDPSTLIVISTDLSHFHDYETANQIDEQTCHMIENLQSEQLEGRRACGYLAVVAMISAAKKRNASIVNLDRRNSGDIAGNHDQVVGYASFAVIDSGPATLARHDQRELLRIAKQSLIEGVQHGCQSNIDPNSFSESLQKNVATFVTLHIKGNLRGCTGSIAANRSIAEDVAASAFTAGFKDPRFEPLTEMELGQLDISISALSPFETMSFVDQADVLRQMKPHAHGYLLKFADKRGLLLPSVWKSISDKAEFLKQLKHKAGLKSDFWDPGIQIQRFSATSFAAHFDEIVDDVN